MGRLSYSLYLWHWPIFYAAFKLSPNDAPLPNRLGVLAIALTVTMIAATGSYYFVERRFLRLKDRLGVRGLRSTAQERPAELTPA